MGQEKKTKAESRSAKKKKRRYPMSGRGVFLLAQTKEKLPKPTKADST